MAQTDEIPEDPKGLDSYGVVVKITDFHSGGPGLNYLLGAAVWCSGKPFIHPADHVLKHPWTLTRCSSTIIYEHTPSGSTKWLKKLLMVTSLDMVTQTFLGSTDRPSFNWRTIKMHYSPHEWSTNNNCKKCLCYTRKASLLPIDCLPRALWIKQRAAGKILSLKWEHVNLNPSLKHEAVGVRVWVGFFRLRTTMTCHHWLMEFCFVQAKSTGKCQNNCVLTEARQRSRTHKSFFKRGLTWRCSVLVLTSIHPKGDTKEAHPHHWSWNWS